VTRTSYPEPVPSHPPQEPLPAPGALHAGGPSLVVRCWGVFLGGKVGHAVGCDWPKDGDSTNRFDISPACAALLNQVRGGVR
jgi:hypothetical protein